MEPPPSLSTFQNFSHPCVSEWMEKMNEGTLTCSYFKEHWRVWVPKIYSPEPNSNCLDLVFDEDTAQKVLFLTLEEFICNGDPKVVLKELSQMDNVICGKVFKMGEATYSCRECGVDSTCVLCADCFKQSAHRNHKYRMGTSAGGGFCDCGDTEAWKKEPFCNTHLAGIQAKESHGNKLPGDIAERAVITFEAVLRYCHTILSIEHKLELPPDLSFINTEFDDSFSLLLTTDDYCTVLFNDETHTFDQVITTLTRVMDCSQRDALEFVTNVDRDGRAVVKCAEFQQCKELENDIEKFTARHSNRPLNVLVVHAHVIAHQIFAMKLLHWLQQFINPYEGFRVLFSNVALNATLSVNSIVEGILLKDSQLWKSARTAWHRLLMSGMLMEYESKKALAIVFTNNYGSIMKDYIRDDHDLLFSIVSFSVQLFTVPTLAHYLIAHRNALFIILNAFISESSRRCNAAGKLEFERDTPNISFKRALYMLQDLRYLLTSKPDVWTDELRKSFLQAFSRLLALLSSMQCMDSVVRHVNQHMEYEPEWESAFNLHIRLSPVISLFLQWCGSDQIVLIKAFRLVLKKLYEQPGHEIGPPQVRELADHSATCLQYDVSFQRVSIHLPLSRLLAGLFPYLEMYDLHFQCAEFINHTKPTLEQIIEPVLATQVMIAQVHSGMWKRNGYSLLNQLYFYHNVKCRLEMLDRDIILLQAGASLIESNEFLIHVLNKFNILQWASPDFDVNVPKCHEDGSTRQTLVEEFLGFLITIIGERYVLGVGQVTADDILKKEIIQQLCIKPLSHSELSKTLSDDMYLETEMERVIQDIADFKKPSQASGAKGVYELKPHLYSEYNVFFYHYTKEEVSNSEETQRKRRKALGELECCPPPKLPKLTEGFSLVTNLLQCDVMLHIMQIVLERALNCRPYRFSESQVHKILHLIGYALQEQESNYYPFFAFTTRAAKWNIYKLLEDLSSNPRIEAHKDLLTWTLTKYKEVAGNTPMEVSTTATAPCTENVTSKHVEMKKEWRTKMVAIKRERIMAQMAAMQKHFMRKNAELFAEPALDTDKSNDEDSSMNSEKCPRKIPVAVGIRQTERISDEKTYKTCILCQEDQIVTAAGPAMVLAAFVQQSTVLCQYRPNTDEPDPLYLSAKLGASPHTSTCGHIMHLHCWREYYNNVIAKESRRPFRSRQPASFDVEKQEYLCPLCECLSNIVLPLLPAISILQPISQEQPELDFDTWLKALSITIQDRYGLNGSFDKTKSIKDEHDPTCWYCVRPLPCHIQAIHDELGNVANIFQSVYSQPRPYISIDLLSTIHHFAQAAYTKEFGTVHHEDDDRIPLLAWKSTAYSIHAIEFLLRDMDKPLFGALSYRQRDSLEGLVRISAVLACKYNIRIGRQIIQNNALSLLTLLLRNPHEGPSILDWDPFGVLIPLINSFPSLFCTSFKKVPSLITGGIIEFYALQLIFIALIVKILLTSDFNDEMDIDSPETTENTFSESILKLVQALNVNIGTQSAANVWRRITKASLPFLRCCALYFHYISDVPAPEELTKIGGATYENICAYLGLPTTCDELIKPNLDIIIRLINIWKSHPTVQMHLSGASTLTIIKEPLKVNKLVELPEDYSELINMISSFTCPNNVREDSKTPTLCLICGKMLCSQSYCCQYQLYDVMVGACTYHADKCGAGVGLFLRIRECEILFLRISNRGSFGCAPYLDEYGETDQGLRRGHPLRLCHDKYRQLNQMWLGHGLYESISRAIESSSSPVSTRWQHL